MNPPEGYRYALPIRVRFADLDAMGHLNNVTYLTYAEQARIEYMRDVCLWDGIHWNTLGMILARSEIDYRFPIAFEDEVVVYMRVSRLGTKSFDVQAIIMAQRPGADPVAAAEILTVMVSYDYQADTTIPVPESWRERIIAYEPALSDKP